MLQLARRALPRATAAAVRRAPRRNFALPRPIEDGEAMLFPREGPGRCYALNWSLC